MHITVPCHKVCVLHCSTTSGVFSNILPRQLLHWPSLPPLALYPAANPPVSVTSPSTVNSPPKVVHKLQFLFLFGFISCLLTFFFSLFFFIRFVLCCTMKKMLGQKKKERKIFLWPIVGPYSLWPIIGTISYLW